MVTIIRVVDAGTPMEPGCLQKWRDEWVLACPSCGKTATLDHEVTVHEDGTVTISPSVICPWDCGAHFLVQRGQVVSC